MLRKAQIWQEEERNMKMKRLIARLIEWMSARGVPANVNTAEASNTGAINLPVSPLDYIRAGDKSQGAKGWSTAQQRHRLPVCTAGML